jgi:hypothetical protein
MSETMSGSVIFVIKANLIAFMVVPYVIIEDCTRSSASVEQCVTFSVNIGDTKAGQP